MSSLPAMTSGGLTEVSISGDDSPSRALAGEPGSRSSAHSQVPLNASMAKRVPPPEKYTVGAPGNRASACTEGAILADEVIEPNPGECWSA